MYTPPTSWKIEGSDNSRKEISELKLNCLANEPGIIVERSDEETCENK